MLSILKNKENIATQILNQFDVDYDLFRNELGVVKSNDIRSEYAEENDDDFDEEKKYSQQKARSSANNKKNTPALHDYGGKVTSRVAIVGLHDTIGRREEEIERVSQI